MDYSVVNHKACIHVSLSHNFFCISFLSTPLSLFFLLIYRSLLSKRPLYFIYFSYKRMSFVRKVTKICLDLYLPTSLSACISLWFEVIIEVISCLVSSRTVSRSCDLWDTKDSSASVLDNLSKQRRGRTSARDCQITR